MNKELIETLKDFTGFDEGDLWGSYVHIAFELCDHLFFERSVEPPSELGYMPSICGKSNDDPELTDELSQYDNHELIRVGEILARHFRRLKQRGIDY